MMDTAVVHENTAMDAAADLKTLKNSDDSESSTTQKVPVKVTSNHDNMSTELNDSLEEIYINHLDENMHNCDYTHDSVTKVTGDGYHGDADVDVDTIKQIDGRTRSYSPVSPSSHNYTSLEDTQSRVVDTQNGHTSITNECSAGSLAKITPSVCDSLDGDPNQYKIHHSKNKYERERCSSVSSIGHKVFPISPSGSNELRNFDVNSIGSGSRSKMTKHCSADSLDTRSSVKSYHEGCFPEGYKKIDKPNMKRRQTISGRFRSQQICHQKHTSVSNDGAERFLRKPSMPSQDWGVFEQDPSKLTNAQKRRVAMTQFATSRYKYGLPNSPGKNTPTKNSETQVGRKSSSKKPSKENEDRTPNGTCMKAEDGNVSMTKFVYELDSSCSVYGAPTEKYQTPLQQKERQNKELHQQVKELQQIIQKREDEIYRLMEERQQQMDEEFREREQAINDIEEEHKKEIEELHMKHAKEIQEMQLELKKMAENRDSEIHRRVQAETTIAENIEVIEELNNTIELLKREHHEREACHRNQYLATYKKGQLIHEIETEEEVVHEAAKNPQHKTVKKLLKKLDKTEQQLEKIQAYRRQEVYENGPQVNGDSEAIVELLRSAIYYYLIDREPVANLKAIMSVMDYTDVQRRAIVDGLKKKKK